VSASRQTALLYERHRQRLLGLCRNRLDCRADAEDALQQTFVYALRCLDRGVVPQNETAWLNVIAENVCRAWRRNSAVRARRETVTDVELLPEHRSEPDRTGDAHDLTAALAVLPFEQRRALLLREWHGLSYREVAAELATTEAAVETLIFRARRRAAAALADARRVFDVAGALAGIRKALGALGAKGGAAAAAGCVTVAAAVPLVRSVELHVHRTAPVPAQAPASASVSAPPSAVEPTVSRALHAQPAAVKHVARAEHRRNRAAAVSAPAPASSESAPAPAVEAPAAPAAPAPPAGGGAAAAPAAAPAPAHAPAAPAPAAPAPAAAPTRAEQPPAAAPSDPSGAVDNAVHTVGSVVDTATTAVGSVVDAVKPIVPVPVPVPAPPAVPAPPPLPAPTVPPVTVPTLP
jgi:RNA polymerase sigma factor (sigma-70 family)